MENVPSTSSAESDAETMEDIRRRIQMSRLDRAINGNST